MSRAAAAEAAPSVDQLAAAELAVSAAETADLAIASNVTNLSISLNAKSQLAQSDGDLLTKPQIVEITDSRYVKEYKAVIGETVPSVARKFGLSEETVRWANNLTSDSLNAGQTLKIPGTNGVIYIVKSGDTVESLASKYKADATRIITYNDAELTGLSVGQQIVIPGGVLPENERPGYRAPTYSTYSYYSYAGSVVGNRYDYGYCTWYAYQRRAEIGRPVGSFWGNANTWRYYAQSSGYTVNRTPAAGAVLTDQGGYYGHVAFVERVDADGTVYVREMNYLGWNIVSPRTLTASEASAYYYIH